jgi:MFS family permease
MSRNEIDDGDVVMTPTDMRGEDSSVNTAANNTRPVGTVPFGMRADMYLFLQLFVGIFVAIADGTVFSFGLISPALNHQPFNFTTREVNTVSTVGVIASYFSIPTGLLYDRTSPRVTLLGGAAINIVGWMLMYLAFSGDISISVAAVAACYSVSQLASPFFETASVLPNLDAFSLHEGRIVIIQKVFMGLGSSVIATLFSAFFIDADLKWFFLFLCLLSGTAGSVGAFFIRRPQHYPELDVKGLNVGETDSVFARQYDRAFYAAEVVLAFNVVFIFTTNLVQSEAQVSREANFVFGFVMIALFFSFGVMLVFVPRRDVLNVFSADSIEEELAPIITKRNANDGLLAGAGADDSVLPVVENLYPLPVITLAPATDIHKRTRRTASFTITDETNADTRANGGAVEDVGLTNPRSAVKNTSGLMENVRRPELWLMWYVSFATWGAMTMVNSNVPQIYRAVVGPANFENTRNAVFVSLFGTGSALGRIAVGLAKPRMDARGKAVWWQYPFSPLVMALSLPLFLILPGQALVLPFFLIGLATGITWGASLLIIKRLFVEAGRHYNFLYTAGMGTPLFFNLWLFSSVYESHSREQHQPKLSECDGVACIGLSIGIATMMNVFAIPVAFLFAWRMDKGTLFM